MINIFCLASKT